MAGFLGGALRLRQTEERIGLLRRLTACFAVGWCAERVEHRLAGLLAQRIFGQALGYEHLNDHEQLRHDPLLGVVVTCLGISVPLSLGQVQKSQGSSVSAAATAHPRPDADRQFLYNSWIKRKSPCNSLKLQGPIWCGEGDLNPHGLSPASTSS